ncbi:hypothetical protein R1flu_005988 [Riccia fluitans]|uniref:Uncharacterized protein n=1 Tax=Riccia fluitans TaxID=41844 RepID=A0ABD1YXI0_9MARC
MGKRLSQNIKSSEMGGNLPTLLKSSLTAAEALNQQSSERSYIQHTRPVDLETEMLKCSRLFDSLQPYTSQVEERKGRHQERRSRPGENPRDGHPPSVRSRFGRPDELATDTTTTTGPTRNVLTQEDWWELEHSQV